MNIKRGLTINVAHRLLLQRQCDLQTDCWLWTGATMPNGYGVIGLSAGQLGASRKGNYLVHRVAGVIFRGWSLLDKLLTCHSCDRRSCFNPQHLFQGTHKDNMNDMWTKGRGPDQHHPRKLNEQQVREIRLRYELGGCTTRSLAKELGLGKSTIEAIINWRIWGHI